jgi:hypothetical protein
MPGGLEKTCYNGRTVNLCANPDSVFDTTDDPDNRSHIRRERPPWKDANEKDARYPNA